MTIHPDSGQHPCGQSETIVVAEATEAAPLSYELSVDGTWMSISPEVSSLLGYSLEELQSQHFTLFSHHEDVEIELVELERLLLNEIEYFDLQKRFIARDGTHVRALIRCFLLRDEQGIPQKYGAYLRPLQAEPGTPTEAEAGPPAGTSALDLTVPLQELQQRVEQALNLQQAFAALVGFFYGAAPMDALCLSFRHPDGCKPICLWLHGHPQEPHSFEAASSPELEQAVCDGQPRLVERTSSPEDSFPSRAIAPLTVCGEIFGALEIFLQRRGILQPAHMELLAQITELIGPGLARFRPAPTAPALSAPSPAPVLPAQEWRTIAEHTGDTIELLGSDGTIRLASPSVKKHFGYEAEHLRGRNAFEFVRRDDLEYLRGRLKEALDRPGTPVSFGYYFLCQQGSWRFVEGCFENLLGDPSAQGIVKTFRDATERKKTEEILRTNEERLRLIIEATHDGIWEWDILKGHVTWSERVYGMFGLTHESFDGSFSTVFEMCHPEDRARFSSALERHLKERKPFDVCCRFRRSDRSYGTFLFQGKASRDAGNQPVRMVGCISDITEQSRAEAALRKSEATYRTLVETTNTGYLIMDVSGIVLDANAEYVRLTGRVSLEQIRGRNVMEWTSPADSARNKRALQQCAADGFVRNLEMDYVSPTGSITQVEINATVISTDEGPRIVTLCRDITERKRDQEKLRESEASLARAQQITHLGSWEEDLSNPTGTLRWSTEVYRIFGYEPGEIEPSRENFFKLVHPDDRETIKVAIEQAIAHHKPCVIDHRIVLPNGSERVVQEQSETIYDSETGLPQKMVGVVQDITERKKAEIEIKKLAAFAQFNPNPVLEFNGDGALNYFNQSAADLAPVVGKSHPQEIIPRNTVNIVKEALQTGRSALRIETTLNRRTISWSFFPIKAIGVVHCYAGDVTERHNLEAQLRQSQKMESVGQLAGGIAHDFNNILTVIQGHSSLLLNGERSPAVLADSAQQIFLSAERAANLTRQLLTFSRKQVIQPKNLDLNEVVNNMTKMLRRILGEDITLHVNYSSTVPLIYADPGMVEQILMNLSVNSRDAMPKGGDLTIDTAVARVNEEPNPQHLEANPGLYVCLRVTDSGSGIAKENLPHIFDPFFTTKGVGRGTGLGLATVYGIVKQHWGWIETESELAVGTTFKIYFPVSREERKDENTKSDDQKIRGGSETILLVEDEAALRQLVRHILERYGYQVIEASSGLDARKLWDEHKSKIHLLLTDMVMPDGVTGRELAEALQADRPNIKIVYTSGYSEDAVGSDLNLREGFNFLQKPYHPRKLAQTVRHRLDS